MTASPLIWRQTAHGFEAELDRGMDTFRAAVSPAAKGGGEIEVEHQTRGNPQSNYCPGTLEEAQAQAKLELREFVQTWSELDV